MLKEQDWLQTRRKGVGRRKRYPEKGTTTFSTLDEEEKRWLRARLQKSYEPRDNKSSKWGEVDVIPQLDYLSETAKQELKTLVHWINIVFSREESQLFVTALIESLQFIVQDIVLDMDEISGIVFSLKNLSNGRVSAFTTHDEYGKRATVDEMKAELEENLHDMIGDEDSDVVLSRMNDSITAVIGEYLQYLLVHIEQQGIIEEQD